MVATPKFHLKQSDTHVYVVIHVPYVRIGSMETHVDNHDFMFYCKPYLLRLKLPSPVVDNESTPAKAVYDADTENGTVTIHLPKQEQGHHFAGLDLLTSLLMTNQDMFGTADTSGNSGMATTASAATTAKTASGTLIQEVDPDTGETKAPETLLAAECTATEELQGKNPSSELLGRASYGFGNRYSDIFSALRDELFDLVELEHPDTSTPAERTLQRVAHEDATFDWQRYGADCCVAEDDEDPVLEAAMKMIPFWEKEMQQEQEQERESEPEQVSAHVDCVNQEEVQTSTQTSPAGSVVSVAAVTNSMRDVSVSTSSAKPISTTPTSSPPSYFTEQENEAMRQLPRRTYAVSTPAAKMELLCGLVDVLYGCVYDHRMTDADVSTESNWTIFIHSRTLAWLDPPRDAPNAVRSSIRRSLCYPYMRCWSFTQLCLTDIVCLLRRGKRSILKLMLNAREIFSKSESRYLLNRLWMDDYCVWLQCSVSDKVLCDFADVYQDAIRTVTKDSFDSTWKLNMIEKCYADMKIVAKAKAEESSEEESSEEESSEEESSEEDGNVEAEVKGATKKEDCTPKVLIEEL